MMRSILILMMVHLLLFYKGNCLDVPINVDLNYPAAIVDSRFLSIAIGSKFLKDKFKSLDLLSKKLLTLVNGLNGGDGKAELYLRAGGKRADHTEFNPNMYIFDAKEFDKLYDFANKLQWKLILGLNVLNRQAGGSWDPSNALTLINYSLKKKYSVWYELGNEPDLFPKHLNITIPPEHLAHDFKTLHQILDYKTHQQSMLIGPDIASLDRYNYFENVLSNIEEDVLHAVTFHHYYSASDNITVCNFTSVEYLDTFIDHCQHALSIIEESFSVFPHPPVWIGETSSTYGGGSPDAGESFAAGFVWLDKLGLAAQMNISVVIRQKLKGGHYSLLNDNYDPNPDYWSSLLYKQLIGQRVLNLTGYLQHNREVRVYAHCVSRFNGRNYKPLSVVLMMLNLSPKETANIRLKNEDLQESDADQYLFTPSNGNLSDKSVRLNGKILRMLNDTTLPEIEPVRISQPYELPPLTYGYFVIRNSYSTACSEDH